MAEKIKVLAYVIFSLASILVSTMSAKGIMADPTPLPPNWGGLALAAIFALLAIAWRPA